MSQKSVFFYFFALFLVLSTWSHAQQFSVGIRGGGLMNWAGFGDKAQKDTFATGVTFGYTGGFQVGFPLKKNFSLLIEGSYSRKGRSLKFNDKKWENRASFNFVDATMLLRKSYKFYIRKNVPSEWFVNLGPEVSYLINGKGKLIVNGNKPGYDYAIVFDGVPDGNYRNMYYNDVNRWLFGIVIGAGFKAPLKRNQHITTELRFTSGHTNLGRKNSSHLGILGFEDTMKTNFKVLTLSFAYTFNFDVKESRKGKSTLKKRLKKDR